MKKLTLWNKIKLFFWTKNRIMEELIKINRILEIYNENLVDKLEELDQSKTYIVHMPGATKEEIECASTAFKLAAKSIKWTTPKIIFMNTIMKKQQESEK